MVGKRIEIVRFVLLFIFCVAWTGSSVARRQAGRDTWTYSFLSLQTYVVNILLGSELARSCALRNIDAVWCALQFFG